MDSSKSQQKPVLANRIICSQQSTADNIIDREKYETAAIEETTAKITTTSNVQCVASRRNICRINAGHTRNKSTSFYANRRGAIVLGAILITIAVFVLNPESSNNNRFVEGKKVKKAVKALVKNLILQDLTTKKNFLPLPVPIPGKWRQLLMTVVDSGLLDNSDLTGKNSFSSSSSKNDRLKPDSKKTLLATATGLLFAKPSSLLNSIGAIPNSQSNSEPGVDMKNVKKLTRLAAASYAGRMIKLQAAADSGKPSLSSSGESKDVISSASGDLVQKAAASTANGGPADRNSKNDVLVTAFNVVKLAQQLKELDPTKLLKIYKKTSIPSGATTTSRSSKAPHSMNINNMKTFSSKLNYIRKLTHDFRNNAAMAHV